MCLMNLPHQKLVTKMSFEIKLLLWEFTFFNDNFFWMKHLNFNMPIKYD